MIAGGFTQFREEVQRLCPRTAVVLGSGLSPAAAEFREAASVPFSQVPGLPIPTVHGHAGRIAVGEWGSAPALVCFGRLHFYEGHSWEMTTEPVRILAELGAKRIVLTNSAGGIHPDLGPGSVMAIREHIDWLDRGSWRELSRGSRPPSPYSEHLVDLMSSARVKAGTYASVTGPCYETPAEVRALAVCGADGVGMSTVREAETAAILGLEVAAISCITNRAAGLGDKPPSHTEVLTNAGLAMSRLQLLLRRLIST